MSKRGPEDEGPAGIHGPPPGKLLQDDSERIKAARPAQCPVLFYKDTEPLQGLPELFNAGGEGSLVEVFIQPDYMSKDNRRVKARQIWGDVRYTPDSDVVAVLMHMGYYVHYVSHPPASVAEFRVLLRLLPPQEKYFSKARFVKSRAWSSSNEGCSYEVHKCWLVTRVGTVIELRPCVDEVPAPYPTVLPQGADRQVQTRTGKGKQSQEVTVQFNLCNEPWLKYTLSAIADKGLKPASFTAARLHHEVLFLETHRERYQICSAGSAGEGDALKEVYTLARCKAPLPITLLRKVGVPMPAELVEVVESGVEWEELKWGVASMHVRGKEIPVKRMQFISMEKPKDGDGAAS